MLSIRGSLAVAFLLWVSSFPSLLGQSAKSAADGGRNIYTSSCAGCHGLDGRGGDKGINIATNTTIKSFSDAQLLGIISNGVPGTGMPAFHSLGDNQVRAVIAYLRTIQGKVGSRTLPGDAKRGKNVFFGKGACSSCHTVSGEGGFTGPDLSAYASGFSAQAIRDEVTKAKRTPSEGYRAAVLTLPSGDRLEGLIRNEDNFSIQFQTKDGAFYLLQKSDLHGLDRLEASWMPTDYGERLSESELNDLVSYLMTVAPAAKPLKPHDQKDD